jgi:hypothetical protein
MILIRVCALIREIGILTKTKINILITSVVAFKGTKLVHILENTAKYKMKNTTDKKQNTIFFINIQPPFITIILKFVCLFMIT